MNFSELRGTILSGAKENSPLILSVLAGVGTLTTAYLTGKASYEAAGLIRKAEKKDGPAIDRKERLKFRTKLVWKLYIPAGISATSTVACIVGANRVSVKKTLAAQTAFTVSQQLYSEYRDKVIEEIGAHKDQSIRDKIAEERVKKNPPPSQDVLFTGPGVILCCEMFTGRYFTSDMETLRRAENDVNSRLFSNDYANLNDFYYLVGLQQTSYSGEVGWKVDKLLKLGFSAVLTEDGRPCLAFDYNYTTPL